MIGLFRVVVALTIINFLVQDAKADLTIFASQIDFDESVDLDTGNGL